MSQENVEIVRRFCDAFERDGLDGLLRQLHPEVASRACGCRSGLASAPGRCPLDPSP
jgi:hypothetical protein